MRPAPRARSFYGWPMLVGLAVAELFSWGILYYSFSVFVHPIERELGWSRAQVTGAFSVALLVSGLAALPVGHWLDRHGPRALMTLGSAAGALLLAAFATVRSLYGLYAVWAGIGLVMATVLYEPAFAVVARWFVRHRGRALTILTLFGGLASTVLVPTASWLVERRGWREAAVTLAVVLAATTVPIHGLMLRKEPADVGQAPDGDTPAAPSETTGHARVPLGLSSVLSEPRFWSFTAASSLGSLVTVAAGVHALPYLIGAGVAPGAAALVAGTIGLAQLPGRLVFEPVRRRLGWAATAVAVLLVQAAALVVLASGTSAAALAAFACLFGIGNGVSTLVRASTLPELYGTEHVGRLGGVVALFGTIGRASGPVVASLLYLRLGGYPQAFVTLSAVLALAAALVVLAARAGATRHLPDALLSVPSARGPRAREAA